MSSSVLSACHVFTQAILKLNPLTNDDVEHSHFTDKETEARHNVASSR